MKDVNKLLREYEEWLDNVTPEEFEKHIKKIRAKERRSPHPLANAVIKAGLLNNLDKVRYSPEDSYKVNPDKSCDSLDEIPISIPSYGYLLAHSIPAANVSYDINSFLEDTLLRINAISISSYEDISSHFSEATLSSPNNDSESHPQMKSFSSEDNYKNILDVALEQSKVIFDQGNDCYQEAA